MHIHFFGDSIYDGRIHSAESFGINFKTEGCIIQELVCHEVCVVLFEIFAFVGGNFKKVCLCVCMCVHARTHMCMSMHINF
jgi:hypothetical protein